MQPASTSAIPDDQVLYVLLDKANIEVGKSKDGLFRLLDSDQSTLLKKNRLNPQDYRPDIVHMCLLMLLDSPLNQSGHLKIFIRTSKGILIDVSPEVRLPRTLKRFSGLMVELLQKRKVRASESKKVLLRVVRNNIHEHLPPGCQMIGFSAAATKQVEINDFVARLDRKTPRCFVVGAFAHGQVDLSECEEQISISEHHLSGAVVCSKICCAFERKFGIS
ncbi:putative Ribosomal RNA small subunit methyltransferase NEP1 [Blattamonas nauphoetae]|uniref:Ribosomal RNA small subunit methyltransferase NEP1 n=1 Tax=Blattamonas nauphoetae TaxID=2049346 RepID=A0ABQ9XJ04_9EUKA|nr:putative Ribosomal RNA small subunit methyltransferase NEP1 [Blattamonas nauphoetae]